MPRQTRKCPPGLPVHVIQRGNNRQVCFTSESDLEAYANWLFEASFKYQVNIHAWVFMTNHVHLLMTPSCWFGISKTMQYLGRFYVRHFTKSIHTSDTHQARTQHQHCLRIGTIKQVFGEI